MIKKENVIRNRIIQLILVKAIVKTSNDLDLLTELGDGNDHHAETELLKLLEEVKKLYKF